MSTDDGILVADETTARDENDRLRGFDGESDPGDHELGDFDELDEEIEIELVVLDMVGTTVIDDGLVERACEEAAREAGIADDDEQLQTALQYVCETMGQSTIEVFRALAVDEDQAQHASAAFESAYAAFIETDGAEAVAGAEEAIRRLRAAGTKVVLTTGFARETQQAIIASLGWEDLVDLVLGPSDAGCGRPHPDLPLTALLRTGTSQVGAVVVVGDTASDITSGHAAGAGLVVGVLTGAHDEETLTAAGADAVIDSIAELPELLGLDD